MLFILGIQYLYLGELRFAYGVKYAVSGKRTRHLEAAQQKKNTEKLCCPYLLVQITSTWLPIRFPLQTRHKLKFHVKLRWQIHENTH